MKEFTILVVLLGTRQFCSRNLLYLCENLFDLLALGSANHHTKLSLSPTNTEVVHYVNDSHIVICNGHNNTRVGWISPKEDVIVKTKGRIHVEESTTGIVS